MDFGSSSNLGERIMREIVTQIRIYDDLDHARDKSKNEAAHTVTVGLNGVWRELDLSEDHHKELIALLQPYQDAGHVPAEAPKPNDPLRGKRSSPEFAYMQGMREFAKANNLRYVTSTGKFYYSTSLRKAYAEHLAKEARGETTL